MQLFFILIIILNTIMAILVTLGSQKRPGPTWAWLVILFSLPILGLMLYFVFGREGSSYNSFAKKHDSDTAILEKLRQLPITTVHDINDIALLNTFMAGSPLHSNNNVDIFHDGTQKFDKLLEDINSAKSSVHILYYIIKNDELGRRIINALTNKAKEGIEVKLVVDKLGSRFLRKKIIKPLTEASGVVSVFAAPLFVRLNFRNHRKICVIDGQIGYVGGFNIGNEYLGKWRNYQNWRDCHIRLTGDAVSSLQAQFLMDFNYCSQGSKIDIDSKYFPDIHHSSDGISMQIVSSGPDTKYSNILYAFIKMISSAKRYVYIQTPYFVPDESLLDTLITACYSGIDVRIMIPKNPDHPFVFSAGLAHLAELIRSGAKCYGYTDGFLHSKVMLVDGEIATVGTANMDIRSLRLNFEINAFIYNEAITGRLEDVFMADIQNSVILDLEWYNNRSIFDKIKEGACRLVSPLL